ncbi:MAG TPA: FAD-dependent oxidoreductase, partial [Actinomycetota bacterium]|nr:FAD-dependent oxidoreductase [Actinomycetota bacterium]
MTPGRYDAVVVGAGPNGLAAAVTIARAGRSVLLIEARPTPGGGTRTEELTEDGFLHDVCSAVHPLAAASPVFRAMGLENHGVEWVRPPVAMAHPLDGGRAAALAEDLDETAEALGPDAGRYMRI